ncbi:hypothetical protein JNW90_13185 [Micromonospora sp. STR1s_5]|nr:hypothetical protein [Micromonospora sp. STR1s_5]
MRAIWGGTDPAYRPDRDDILNMGRALQAALASRHGRTSQAQLSTELAASVLRRRVEQLQRADRRNKQRIQKLEQELGDARDALERAREALRQARSFETEW